MQSGYESEGTHAYLAGVANDAGLIVVDVADPARPLRLGSFKDPTCSESVTIAGSFAYLSHGDKGLEIIDLSQPLAPTVSRHVDAAGHVRGVQTVGSIAYVANGYTGLRLLDVSDRTEVREISHLETYRALDVQVEGAYAYVADDWAGIKIVDVSNPSQPREARDGTPRGTPKGSLYRTALSHVGRWRRRSPGH